MFIEDVKDDRESVKKRSLYWIDERSWRRRAWRRDEKYFSEFEKLTWSS